MKNIYKLLKGVIVMMIAITGIAAHASTPLLSSLPGPMYVLYPPTNLYINVMEGCTAYLTWDKPHNPGGTTPPGLLGYRIYRDGSFLHYISDPDSLFYYDYVDNIGTFTDSVTAYYDLTSYGSPGTYGESAAASGIFTADCGMILPFFEPWDMASFNYQMWSFLPSQGNWAISTTQGNPLPTALFTGMPTLSNYDRTLQSILLECIIWNCANIYLEFDSRSIITNPTSQEKLITEIKLNGTWYPKDSLVNDISTGWVHHKIDITEAAGNSIRVGFRAKGINSANIGEWDVDNIYVYTVCFKPPNFSLNRTGNSVHLSWGIPCTGKKINPNQGNSSTLLGYNVYRTDDTGLPPFMKITTAWVIDTNYVDVLPPTFDGVACYFVTAVYMDSLNPGHILCEPPSDTLCVQYTSWVPVQNEAQVLIFPNPASDELNIASDQPFTGIEMLNFLGEKIYSESFQGTKNVKIVMKDNPNGIYLLKIKFNDAISVRKVLKKK